jgi:hypothetical protein
MTEREKALSNLQELIQLNPKTDNESGLLIRSILSAGRKKGVHRHELLFSARSEKVDISH